MTPRRREEGCTALGTFVTVLCALGWIGIAAAAGTARAQGIPAKPAQGGKDLVAILEFDAAGATKPQAAAVTDRLQDALLKRGHFALVDRGQIDKILGEQAFQQSACISQDCAVRAGKMLGVKHIITGRVSKIDDTTWQLAGALIYVESGETLRAESLPFRGEYFKLLSGATLALAEKLSAPAVSLVQQADENVTRVCQSDVRKLCGNVEPGGGRLVQCLNRRIADASPECRQALQQQRARIQQRQVACKPDMDRLCKDVKIGEGRLIECLKQHRAELSADCGSFIR